MMNSANFYERRNLSDSLWKSLVSCKHKINVFLRPCETSVIEIVCENSQWLKNLNYFRKKTIIDVCFLKFMAT